MVVKGEVGALFPLLALMEQVCGWKSISCGWPSFVRHIQFEVGAGFIIRFWQDIWFWDTSLCVLYLRLFS